MYIVVDIALQKLWLYAHKEGDVIQSFLISSAKNGTNEIENSFGTPRGRHKIAEKIGAGCLANTVFVGRKPTGEYYSEQLKQQYPDRDWILTRILRLDGLEPGFNQGVTASGACCDSFARFIYIHGTPESTDLSQANSRGCIRMANEDVIKLFDQVAVGTIVEIRP